MGRNETLRVMSEYSFCLSKVGRAATGPRAGSGNCILLFEVAAVELVTSGQSFIMPCGTGTKDATPGSRFRVFAVRFFGFAVAVAQQSCECFAWQLWLSAVAVELSTSAPIVLQPKRQPPAIQMETLTESSNRTALFEKNRLIWLEVYPSRNRLSRKRSE